MGGGGGSGDREGASAKRRKSKKSLLEEGVSSENEEDDHDVEEDDKMEKRRSSENKSENACLTRLFMIFVSAVCIAFLDMSFAQKRLYGEIFYLPTESVMSKAQSTSRRAHRNTEVAGIVEDTAKTELLLVRAGAVNKPHFDFEKDRIERVLNGGELLPFVATGDPDKEADDKTLDLIKTKEEVLKMEKRVNTRIARRIAKMSPGRMDMSLGGYDLSAAELDAGGVKIHGNKELIDYFALATSRGPIVEKKLEAAAQAGSADTEDNENENAEGETEDAAMAGGLSRRDVYALREPDPDFAKFVQELRSDATYAHMHKKNDMGRALKLLGYKQSAKSSKKTPLILGDENKCPAQFKVDENRITLCPIFLPQNKADQYFHIQNFAEKVPECKLKPDFYPLTWRLFRLEERAKLKEHCTNETMTDFGVAYVRKFTVPGDNYMKSADSVYEQLEKSEKSVKELRKETKNRAVVQLYINNPLLIEERKFIIRTYAVIVSDKPMIVYYSDGAVLRSVIKYQPFSRHDSDYKKAAHITSEQKSANKKLLKSSELYMSFNSLQTYLTEMGNDSNYVNTVLRPHMKARMIYALYAIMRRQRGSEEEGADEDPNGRASTLPRSTAAVQEACFDFILDESKKLWLITVGTGSHCFVTMGGSSFRPTWKSKLQRAVSENTAQLAEEMLWRRQNDLPISSMQFFTHPDMTVLIDETFPDWDVTKEINNHVDGIQVEQDDQDYTVVEADEADNDSANAVEPQGNDEDDDGGDDNGDDADSESD
ncbi:Inactive polyglycylase TTLL10 [Hondaea fermentalgiana]|uniref:Inactive polyglycylase TTLL10 n=1 Tax=Hondaea fermentalgiana TaxID=2315210 RepID=A0A2R5GJT7_9STRA|nr:Inactive polyglycylase TTLL10 [Hondaea fermentalgiana]|eukprot:GBG28124.1 Inactive polyglycylase TTLL10 [Hondaea fermentalgiana]